MNKGARLLEYSHKKDPLTRAFLWLVALVGVLPFGALLAYAHPALDDFAYANQLLASGFSSTQQQIYAGWSGRYASTLWLTLANPLSYHCPTGQWMGGLALLLLWWAALTALARELLRPAGSWAEAALAGLLVLALSLAQLPSPAEGLYWLAGGYTYLVPAAGTIGLLAILVRRQQQPSWLLTALAILLILAVMGGNEINAILLLTGLLVAPGRTARWPLLATAALAIAVAWGAPGNFVRLHSMAHRPGLLAAVGQAGLAAGYCLLTWLGTGVLPLAALLVAGYLARHPAGTDPTSPLNRLTQRPWLLTIWLVGTLVMCFLLGYWVTGLVMPRRARNGVYALFVVGWLLTAWAWGRWYWLRWPPPARWPGALCGAVAGWLALALLSDHNITLRADRRGASSSALVQAYRDWLSGDAARYDQQQRQRYAQLQAGRPATKRLRLDPLRTEPLTLFYADISLNEQLWGNVAYGTYFGGRTVYVDTPARQH